MATKKQGRGGGEKRVPDEDEGPIWPGPMTKGFGRFAIGAARKASSRVSKGLAQATTKVKKVKVAKVRVMKVAIKKLNKAAAKKSRQKRKA